MTQEQEETLKKTITTTTPESHGFQGFLWDMRNVLLLVLILFDFKIPRSTMSDYFVRWGFTAQRPIAKNYKQNPDMVSAINNQGKLRFMTYEGKMNQKRLIEFMKRLIKSNDRKVFLILDNLSVHHGKIAGIVL